MIKQDLNIQENILQQLRIIAPAAFTKGEIDYAKLQELLTNKGTNTLENHGLQWIGKVTAYQTTQIPPSVTLSPDHESSINFTSAKNVFIEGDNLQVLRVLQKSYKGQIKMIYIDPPYNTGHDFIYTDNYRMTVKEHQKETEQQATNTTFSDDLQKNMQESARFHSKWLSMIYPRLILAHQLLREDGVIFVSIGEEEVANLKLLLNEIFGEENFRNNFIVRRHNKNLNNQFIAKGLTSFNVGFEYILCYAKSDAFSFNPAYKKSSETRQKKGYWKGFWNDADRPTMRYDILGFKPETGQWKWKKERADKAIANYEEYLEKYADKYTLEEHWQRTGKQLQFIRRKLTGKGKNKGVDNWIPPSKGMLRTSDWTDLLASKIEPEVKGYFNYPKNIDVLKNLFTITLKKEDDLVLDFFAGSGSTAHALLDYNAQNNKEYPFICVQLDSPVEVTTKAYKAGFQTIGDILLHRIKMVLTKLGQNKNGIRKFNLSPIKLKNPLINLTNDPTILEHSKSIAIPLQQHKHLAMAWEIALKLGYSLTIPIEKIWIENISVFSINKQETIFIPEEVNENILKSILPLKPSTLICIKNTFSPKNVLSDKLLPVLKEQQISLILI